jgi:hypothetical protein
LIFSSGIAVNDLLHGELSKWVSSKSEVGFDGLSSRESPARSALSLVVDGSDDSARGPVVVGWVRGAGNLFGREVSDGLAEVLLWWGNVVLLEVSRVHQILGSELLLGEIRELGNSKGGSWVHSLKFLSVLEVFLESSLIKTFYAAIIVQIIEHGNLLGRC